jgi:hypothetical protein
MSERRACSLVGADRTMIRYRSRCPEDANLRERLRGLAGERRRFGYRRLHVLLRQEGWTVNRKKTERLYREEGSAYTPTARTQARDRDASADPDSGNTERALVGGLRARPARHETAAPHPQ